MKEARSFGEFGKRWMKKAEVADSTRAMRRGVFERDILPTFRNRLVTEIAPDDLRKMCARVKDRGAPATAVHVRAIVKLIYDLCNFPRREGRQSGSRPFPTLTGTCYSAATGGGSVRSRLTSSLFSACT